VAREKNEGKGGEIDPTGYEEEGRGFKEKGSVCGVRRKQQSVFRRKRG
jgi:hypothetical protein